jgi:hypothetical protein
LCEIEQRRFSLDTHLNGDGFERLLVFMVIRAPDEQSEVTNILNRSVKSPSPLIEACFLVFEL